MQFDSSKIRFAIVNLTVFASLSMSTVADAQIANIFGSNNNGGGNNPLGALVGGAGGAGGGSGNVVLDTYMNSLRTALYNQIMAISLVQDAEGDKSKAAALRATASAIQSMKEASKDTIEKSLKSIDENPINPGGLAKVKDADGQKKIAAAEGHMDVARVYDGIAVATGGITLMQLSQGGAGSILKPGVLEALQLTVTSMPAQNENAKKFDEMLKSYMAENKIPALSSGEKTALAKKTDPNAAKQASSF